MYKWISTYVWHGILPPEDVPFSITVFEGVIEDGDVDDNIIDGDSDDLGDLEEKVGAI